MPGVKPVIFTDVTEPVVEPLAVNPEEPEPPAPKVLIS